MNLVTFIKLQQLVKNCDSRFIKDYNFDNVNFEESTYETAYFEIKEMRTQESYYVKIITDDGVYLAQGDEELLKLNSADASRWVELAKTFFYSVYQSKIEDANEDKMYHSNQCYADTLAMYDRHGY